MGFFSEDMLPMLGVYEAETSELMASLDEIATRVEHAKEFTHEDIAELFRCAHTVKGSSAMMGLESLSTLTHRVEDLFDLLRGDPSLAEGRVPEILDLLFSFSDYVKDEIGRMEADDYAPADADGLIAEAASYVDVLAGRTGPDAGDTAEQGEAPQAAPGEGGNAQSGTPVADEPPEEEPLGGDSSDGDVNGTTLKVSFKPDVPMVNARALVIVKQLAGQVNVLSHEPYDLSNAEAASTIAANGLLIVVDPSDVDDAKQQLAKSSFIRRIAVLDENMQAAPNASADQEAEGAESGANADKFIKLRWSNVRDLQDMAGEFLLSASHLKAVSRKAHEDNDLRNAVAQVSRLVEELVYHVDKMAMVSMSAMVPQMSRMVRDMCRNTGKQVSFEVHGGDIEIDRNLYNSISEPLLHIIRNAVDHGIEPTEERLSAGKEARGKVVLTVENLGARVSFRVSDDGRGIDADEVLAKAAASGKLERSPESYSRSEILQMVMLAGLSTNKEVTRYSGRGVGMDVVSTVVRDFNGRVDIESDPGKGTSMTLFMPVSVTSVECLCFRIGPSVYQMPLQNLNKIYTADEAAECLSEFEGSALFDHEKRQIPVLDMHRLLACEGTDTFYIVCHSMDDEFVIGVDDVLGDFNSANKTLPSCLGPKWQAACPIRNVAIMDDGSIGFVLNAALLADLAQGRNQVPDSAGSQDDEGVEDLSGEIGLAANIPSWAFVFLLGNSRYALPVDIVERLSPMPNCAVTPRGMPYLMGLANHRNQVIAVYDLARSAGVQEECPYAVIVTDEQGERSGLSISSAIGVRDLNDAVPAEEQPEPRALAGGFHTTASLVLDPKEPPVTLLAR